MRAAVVLVALLAGCSISVTTPVSPVPVPDSRGPLQVEPHADPTVSEGHWTA